MKRLIIISISCMHYCYAQNSDEWLRQQQTKIKYLKEQIAASQVYITFLEKGYKIAKEGLNVISEIKHGEFNLHLDFFNSLAEVKPAIKKYVRVGDIIARELQITGLCKSAIKSMKQSGQFTIAEINYVADVFLKLLDETQENITLLLDITSSGKVTTTDDARLKIIDRLYDDMESKYAFAKKFSNEAHNLALQRFIESTEIKVDRSLFNIEK